MTGGRGPKAKGYAFEREAVKAFQGAGWEARRAFGSNGEALGLDSDVDLVASKGNVQLKCQNKRRAALASFLTPSDHVDVVLIRQDRGETLIIMPLKKFLEVV